MNMSVFFFTFEEVFFLIISFKLNFVDKLTSSRIYVAVLFYFIQFLDKRQHSQAEIFAHNIFY